MNYKYIDFYQRKCSVHAPKLYVSIAGIRNSSPVEFRQKMAHKKTRYITR